MNINIFFDFPKRNGRIQLLRNQWLKAGLDVLHSHTINLFIVWLKEF